MSLTRAISDAKRIVNGSFSQELTFTPLSGTQVTINGFLSKHNLSIDQNTGAPVNSRNIHATVAEKDLTDAGYTTRNGNNEISLTNHKITWTDQIDGIDYTCTITSVMPDFTLGLIVMTLSEYTA